MAAMTMRTSSSRTVSVCSLLCTPPCMHDVPVLTSRRQHPSLAEAPLAGILGAAHSGSLSPTAAATRPQPTGTQPSSSQDQQQQQGASQPPLRILEGPSTNPEPPPEGLSPPMARGELDSNMESEAGEGVLHSALYALPSELRDPPPGMPATAATTVPGPGVCAFTGFDPGV